jgi:hypothetical protein
MSPENSPGISRFTLAGAVIWTGKLNGHTVQFITTDWSGIPELEPVSDNMYVMELHQPIARHITVTGCQLVDPSDGTILAKSFSITDF